MKYRFLLNEIKLKDVVKRLYSKKFLRKVKNAINNLFTEDEIIKTARLFQAINYIDDQIGSNPFFDLVNNIEELDLTDSQKALTLQFLLKILLANRS